MCKHLVLMREVVIKHHLEFVKSPDLQSYGLRHPTLFNVERLIEESLAAVGGYKFVDEEGYDFSDYSDSKTTTVNQKTNVVTIGSVETKIGALRITAYNPFKDNADYFFVPKNQLARVKRACYGVNDHKERIMFSYSKRYEDDYGYFEDYRVKDFVALATR